MQTSQTSEQNSVKTAPAAVDGMSGMMYAPTPLVGREREFADLKNKVLDPTMRMLTVTGPVGVGKSRLVAALFENVSYEFAHGGRYLDLSNEDENEDLAGILATGLGVSDDSSAPPAERLVSYLSSRHFLLVLDGCEHMLTNGLVQVVANLVASCPRLSILISSLERLGVYGEGLVRLAPLPVPSRPFPTDDAELERVPAVQLFIHRARSVRPGFVLTKENREAVAELCIRLDGLPLAIELASARMKLSTPQALLAEMESDLSVLSGTRADTLSQHTDVRSAIESSLARLRRGDLTILGRLSVFTGEFGFAAAKGLGKVSAAQTQSFLESLVDKNLLIAGERPDGEISFRMLSLTRRYSQEWLRRSGEYNKVMRAHADYFLAMAKTAETEPAGPNQAWWLDQLAYWHEDITMALAYLTDSGAGTAMAGFASALRMHWLSYGRPAEGMHWLEQALVLGDLPSHVAGRVHEVLGELSLAMGEHSVAEDCLAAARNIFEQLRDSSGTASCLRLMGRLAYSRNELAAADRLLEESAAALRALGSPRGQAITLRDLAETRRARGNFRAARKLAEGALQEFVRQQDALNMALTQYVLADVMISAGELDEAEQLCRRAMLLLHDLRDESSVAAGMETLAVIMTVRHGRLTECWRRAARSLASAEAIRDRTGVQAPGPARAVHRGVAEEAQVRLGVKAFEEVWREGRALSVETAMSQALAPVQPAKNDRLVRSANNPLTRRELEVAELVAAGLTNREIARRLGIAEWTVVNHLRKIMRKLDCTSRVHVAGWLNKLQNSAEAAEASSGGDRRNE